MSHIDVGAVAISEEKIDFKQPYANLFDHQELGSGNFGVTYLSSLRRVNRPPLKVVCKVSRKKPGEDEWHEMINLSNLKLHPLVVRLLGVCTDWQGGGGALALIFEYHPGGTLEKLAREQHNVSSDVGRDDFLKIAYAMACSVQHLHENVMLHRDIALRNFVLSREGLPVLIDFGLSRGDVEYRSVGGKPVPWRSMPPEALGGELLSMPKSDVYMLGIAYWQLYNGMETPFPHTRSPEFLLQEMNALLENNPGATTPLAHCESMPHVMRSLVARMCSLGMASRPSASEICDILAEHVTTDLHRFSNCRRDVAIGQRVDGGYNTGTAADPVSEYEYTQVSASQSSSSAALQPRDDHFSPSSSAEASPLQQQNAHVLQSLNASRGAASSLHQEHEHEVKSSELPCETPTQMLPSIPELEITDHDEEPSMSVRGKVMLKHIESAGVEDPVRVTRALRSEKIEARDLRDLTDEQLQHLFPKIGTFIRMKKFINREPSLTNRGNALHNDLDYLKLPNIEAVVRALRKENIDMELLTNLSDQELEELLSKVSEVGTRKLLRQYVKRLRKARPLLPNSLRKIYEVSSVFISSAARSTDDWTKLHIAAKQGKLLAIQRLLKSGSVDPNSSTNNTQATALHIAAMYGNDSSVEILLGDKRVDVNAVDNNGNSALHYAARCLSAVDVLSRLLKDNRFDPNSRNNSKSTPLHLAGSCYNDAAVEMLLGDERVDVNAVDKDGNSALHYFAGQRSGAVMLSRLLKDNRVDPNSENNSKSTPLMFAVRHDNGAAVAMLLSDWRVDVNAVDENGNSALHFAAKGIFSGTYVLSHLLKDNRVDANSQNNNKITPLMFAVRHDNGAAVAMLLGDDRVDVNAVDNDGDSALHYAAGRHSGTAMLSRLLKDKRSDPNSRNGNNRTPLHVATFCGNDAAVSMLLTDDRVDVNAVGGYGDSALHYAAGRLSGTDVLSRLLKDNRSDPNSRNNNKSTPLHVAVLCYNDAAVSMLLGDERVDVNAMDKDGNSALHYAAEWRSYTVMWSRLLKDNRSDPNFRNGNNRTPLHVATFCGNDAVVSMLLSDDRVDVNAVDNNGDSPLHHAARCFFGTDVLSRLLKDNRFDPNSRNNSKSTPLNVAVSCTNDAAVAMLLGDERVDVNAMDKDGNSALHYAAE